MRIWENETDKSVTWYMIDKQGKSVMLTSWFRVLTPQEMADLFNPDTLGKYTHGGLAISVSDGPDDPHDDEVILALETARDLGHSLWTVGNAESTAHKDDKLGHQGPRHQNDIQKIEVFYPNGTQGHLYFRASAFPSAQLPSSFPAGQQGMYPTGVMAFAASTHRRPTLKQLLYVPVTQGRRAGALIRRLCKKSLDLHKHMQVKP